MWRQSGEDLVYICKDRDLRGVRVCFGCSLMFNEFVVVVLWCLL